MTHFYLLAISADASNHEPRWHDSTAPSPLIKKTLEWRTHAITGGLPINHLNPPHVARRVPWKTFLLNTSLLLRLWCTVLNWTSLARCHNGQPDYTLTKQERRRPKNRVCKSTIPSQSYQKKPHTIASVAPGKHTQTHIT